MAGVLSTEHARTAAAQDVRHGEIRELAPVLSGGQRLNLETLGVAGDEIEEFHQHTGTTLRVGGSPSLLCLSGVRYCSGKFGR